MICYHFNIRDGVSLPDVEGTELPTIDHARREAVRIAGYVLMTQPGEFWNGHEWYVETTNDAGDVLFRVKFQAENVAAPMDVAPRGALEPSMLEQASLGTIWHHPLQPVAAKT